MYRDRILKWATALALFVVPSTTLAQTTGQPETPETSETEGPSDEEEAEPEESEDDEEEPADEAPGLTTEETQEKAPMGTPQPSEAPATTRPTPPAEEEERQEEEEVEVVEEEVEVAGDDERAETSDVGVAWNEGLLMEKYRWSLDVGGYIRVGYTGIQDDPSGTFGQHDGFVLGNARLSLEGRMRSLGFQFQLDGAVDRNDDANDPNAEVVTRMKDANLFWQPWEPIRLTAGQFKPPFDVEEQFSTADILFVDRSVGSRGVRNIEGRNVRGLSVQREVGVKIGNEEGWYFLAEDEEREGPGVSYAVAMTNGQDANRSLNDNDKLAGYGRAAFHWGELVSAGGGYYFNDKTIGIEPDTIEERRAAWTADLVVNIVGVTVIGSVMGESTSRPDLEGVEPETTGLAYQGQIAYREPFLGFQPAFRYAYFDPTERSDGSDALTHVTFGLNYVPDYPVRLMLNYTIAQETEEFEIPNNRFDGVLQVTW
jgi:hypothetical protein